MGMYISVASNLMLYEVGIDFFQNNFKLIWGLSLSDVLLS